MIIDYRGKKGINFFGRRYERILGYNCKRTIIKSFMKWFEFDFCYNFILGIGWYNDKNGKLTVKKYNPFYKRIPSRIIFKIKWFLFKDKMIKND